MLSRTWTRTASWLPKFPQGISLPGLINGSGIGIGIRLGWPQSIPGPQAQQELDDGLLKAAPKKKVSHRKKRQRQLAGDKQVKELKNLNRCPACGHYKRAHTLCMHCVKEIQTVWKAQDKASQPAKSTYSEADMDPVDKRVLYPGKQSTEYQQKLRRKADYLYKRPRTLPVDPK